MTARNKRIARELQEARAFLRILLTLDKKRLVIENVVGNLMDRMAKSIDELVDSKS